MRSPARSILALALPVVLLGAGWLSSSLRARDARIAEERARLGAALDRARSAVDAGLRELVAREDERPFYVYSHYYSPPDVLALTDPVAISPLASEAGDARIVGHFELDPDGTLRTPYSVDPGPRTDRAARVLGAIDASTRAALMAELGGSSAGALIASARATPAPSVPAPRRARAALPVSEPAPEIAAIDESTTNNLNALGNMIASDITQAQSGDVEAYERVQQRGRAVPRVARRDVTLDAIAQQATAPQAIATRRAPSSRPAERTPPQPTLPPLVQGEIEVDYTPMALRAFGAHLLLVRVVSHGDARVLDGVVLDRDRIVETWVPDTIARAVPEDAPAIATTSACAARAPASDLLPGVELCAPLAPLERVERAERDALSLEVATLAVLVALSTLAALLVLLAARKASELAQQKSAFVSAVSHELRTPLTTLRMHAEMLDEGLVPADRRDKVHAELVSESVRLARLVENLLEISRLEEGRRPLRVARADLRERVETLVRGEVARARARGFELTVHAPDDPVELAFDPSAIEQMLTNAIDNALKYAAGALERRIEVSLVRRARAGRPGVELRVRDHGPGIDLAERERVFERFYRVERQETSHQPGTGLGLALVRELARAHGGDVEILAGAPGAIVAIWLPLT